ncbi:serine/threonine-protein kinase [Nonomuraea longicatena]|uniref:non-specific serine/threonine protein kinase n=1 Tax=Nonomuraea longicatena TaxID=83682 RepID=A0ABP4AX29_9ACTN
MTSDRKQGGRRIAGRYHLQEPIGRGGMGIVWRAHDELLDRTVAVKEVRYAAALGDEVQLLNRRTMREARAAARFEHPNVIVVHDVIEEDDRPWIVMQLVQSRSLGAVIKQDGPLRHARVAEIGLAVLDALHRAHESGVLHRDVKPENVLLADDGRVVLTDFGIATLETETQLTMTGLAGTPAFIAPERLKGLPARRESDLWALGATLYTAVEGRSPHERGMALATMHAVLTDEPDPMRNGGPLTPVIEGLLVKEPVQRLTYEETARLLRRVVVLAEPETPAATVAVLKPPVLPAGRPSAPPLARPRPQQPAPLPPVEDDTPTDPSLRPLSPLPQTGVKIPVPEATPEPAPRTAFQAPPRTRVQPSVQSWPDPPPPARPVTGDLPAVADERDGDPGDLSGMFGGGADTGDPTMRSRGGERKIWPIVAVASAVILVGGIGGWLGLTSAPDDQDMYVSPDTTAEPDGRPPAPKATENDEPAEPDPEPSTPPAEPKPTPSDSDPKVPAGWKLYKDKSGFSLALPKGWDEFKREGRQIFFRGPGAGSNAFVSIDQIDKAGPDPVKDWKQQEKSAKYGYGGYKKIHIKAVDYMEAAADWEFTWNTNTGKTRVRNRGFVTKGGMGYSIYWHNLASRWKKDLHFFDTFAATFVPKK